MGCICSKGTRANDYVENNQVKDNELPRSSKVQSASPIEDNVKPEETDGNGNEATFRLIPNGTDNAGSTSISSDGGEKKDTAAAATATATAVLERKSSKSPFQRQPTLEVGGGNNNVGPVQPRMTRISSIANGERGAQVVAGWPSWLAAVAGEAINGWIPRKADSFERLEKIGQGTYSSVYKARDLEANKIVALKKVRFVNMDPESVRFMAREIIVLRRLDHPNVMKLEGLITSRVSGSLYLIFEHMDHDLAGLAATPGIKFSEAQIKCYMKQLLHGLQHCHSRGVLHRDIKGANLLLDLNNNLKIGDFGLANFFRGQKKQPLTSRVVTLWYRPPELLLGSTDYGVTVDLWSSGCILAELFTGKPIMPGRTEVEQIHKIFKLCGSPSEEYWKRSKLPHATVFKPQQPYKRCVAETFKDLPSSALALLEVLLAVEPDARGTTSSALQSEFFTTKPLPSDPSSLPKYQPRKEFDAKFRAEESRRRGAGNKESKGVSRKSKAVPAPDANAELLASIQKRQGQTNPTSISENFNNTEEDAGCGFPIEPSKGTAHNSYAHSVIMNVSGDLLSGSSRSPVKELRTQRSYVQRGAGQLSRFSNSVAARDMSHFGSIRDTSVNPHWLKDQRNGRYNNLYGCQSSGMGLLDHPKSSVNDERPSGKESAMGYGGRTGRNHYSGPLFPGGGNLEEMLKEHERQIRLAARRARVNKTRRDENRPTESLLAMNGR